MKDPAGYWQRKKGKRNREKMQRRGLVIYISQSGVIKIYQVALTTFPRPFR